MTELILEFMYVFKLVNMFVIGARIIDIKQIWCIHDIENTSVRKSDVLQRLGRVTEAGGGGLLNHFYNGAGHMGAYLRHIAK